MSVGTAKSVEELVAGDRFYDPEFEPPIEVKSVEADLGKVIVHGELEGHRRDVELVFPPKHQIWLIGE